MEARTASQARRRAAARGAARAADRRRPPVAARDGYDRLAFEKVANRAGVTRNLVYHYFPGGRQELLEAAAHRAGEQLSSDWVTDPAVPLRSGSRRI